MVFELSRREFLELSAAAGLTAVTAPDELHTITPEDRRTVLAIALTLFSHAPVSEAPYLRAVDHVARQCECRFSVYSAVKVAVQRLEWSTGWKYSPLPEAQRVRLLHTMQDTEAFRILYRELLEGLYRTPWSWQLLVRI